MTNNPDNDMILHIVLVEDHDTDKYIVEQAFKSVNARVILHLYDNGLNALENIKMNGTTLKPDLIITDIRMPEKDGVEFIRELKASEDLHDVPVAILSGFTQDFVKLGPELQSLVVAQLTKSELYSDMESFVQNLERLISGLNKSKH